MLTKTLHFDPDVLDVLQNKTHWSEDGLSCKIDPLERKLYEKVAKALAAMGGKWKGGKTQATLFEEDPRPRVEGLLQNGTLTVERDGFFETPKKVAIQMIVLAKIHGDEVRILEPSAGMGAIANEIYTYSRTNLETTVHLDVCEKNEKRASFLEGSGYDVVARDFMEYDPGEVYDAVLMNPPFEEGLDCVHVMHAYNMLKPGGVLVSVMLDNKDYRTNGKYKIFNEWLEGKKQKVEKLPKDAFKESGANVATMIIVLHKPEEIKGTAQAMPKIKAIQKKSANAHKKIEALERKVAKTKAVKSNGKVVVAAQPVLRLLSFKGKTKVYEKALPDGKVMLSGGEPLPDPHTDALGISANILEEMNARWRGYRGCYGWSDAERDAQVRLDFARYGAQDGNILFNPKLDNDNPYSTRQSRKAN